MSEQPSDIAMASNWFPDVVLVTAKRQSDGGTGTPYTGGF